MPYLMHLTFGFISHFFLPNYHISTKLNLSHPLVLKANSLHLWLAFRSSEDPLFCCFHGEEWITYDDTTWDTFTVIMRNVGFHVSL